MAVPLWLVSLLLPLTVVAVPQQDPIQQTGADFKIVVESTEPSRPLNSPMQEPRAAPAAWDLTGTWLDQGNGVYVVTQSGSKVTWSAHSADNRQWGHKFTGTINGDVVEGDFQDVPPYINRLSGHIKLRIVDVSHMTLVSSSGPFGASSWTRQTPVPPNAIPTAAPVPTAPPAVPPGARDLTGTWLDQGKGVYLVTQSGSTVTWSAHSADNRQWGHKFTGTINGDIVEGDFQDVPPYINRLSGYIKLRIVDVDHMTLVSSSSPFAASSWTRQVPVLLRIPRIVARPARAPRLCDEVLHRRRPSGL
jgi:hypothetical protein